MEKHHDLKPSHIGQQSGEKKRGRFLAGSERRLVCDVLVLEEIDGDFLSQRVNDPVFLRTEHATDIPSAKAGSTRRGYGFPEPNRMLTDPMSVMYS